MEVEFGHYDKALELFEDTEKYAKKVHSNESMLLATGWLEDLKHNYSSDHLNNWGDNDHNNMDAMVDLRKLNKTLSKNVSFLMLVNNS